MAGAGLAGLGRVGLCLSPIRVDQDSTSLAGSGIGKGSLATLGSVHWQGQARGAQARGPADQTAPYRNRQLTSSCLTSPESRDLVRPLLRPKSHAQGELAGA